jgi:hypothetical protein
MEGRAVPVMGVWERLLEREERGGYHMEKNVEDL